MKNVPVLMVFERQTKVLKSLLFITLGLGIIAAFFQAFSNRSLWLDEGKLAVNIISRSYTELLQPLDSNQVAPIGFLWIEKLMTQLFGNQDYALRLVPFASYLSSLYFLFKSSKILSKSTVFALFATVLLSFNPKLLYYSWEVKQYATDVLIGLVVLYVSLQILERISVSRIIWYTLLGVMAVWFSNIAVIVLAGFGGIVLWKYVIKKRNFSILVAPLFWTASFVVYYLNFIKDHPIRSRKSMLSFWEYGFLELDVLSKEFYLYFGYIAKDIGTFIIGNYLLLFIPLVGIALGIFFLLKYKNYKPLLFFAVPALVHLVLSVAKLYPMRDRLLLYLIPLAIILFCYGIFYTTTFLKSKQFLAIFIVAVSMVGLLATQFINKYPFEIEEVRSSIEYISSKIEQKEKVYIYGSAVDVFMFYRPLHPSLESHELQYGKHHKRLPAAYIPEIESLKGAVWILFAHSIAKDGSFDEKDFILNELKKRGHTILDDKQFTGSSAVKVKLNASVI